MSDDTNQGAPPPPPPPVVVPPEAGAYQIRLALEAAGLGDAADAAVAGNQPMIDWWAFSDPIQRADDYTNALGTAIGLTSDQVDQLFITAATL